MNVAKNTKELVTLLWPEEPSRLNETITNAGMIICLLHILTKTACHDQLQSRLLWLFTFTQNMSVVCVWEGRVEPFLDTFRLKDIAR